MASESKHITPAELLTRAATARSPRPAVMPVLADMAAGARIGAFREVALEKLHPDPRNVRKSFKAGELEELAASMKKVGIVEPLLARPDPALPPDELYITAGERRYRAAKLAV